MTLPAGQDGSTFRLPNTPSREIAVIPRDGPPHLRQLIEDIVADVFDVDATDLRRPTRGRARIALARQVAMYIAHIGYGMTLTEAGDLFGRDRTTVAHACGVVECRRDDIEFDRAVVLLELIVRALVGAQANQLAARDSDTAEEELARD